MAYTIGASHGPFTGTGSFAIAKPAGIRTIVTGIPFYTGHDGSSPVRYFRLGRFTLGNSHGFYPSHGVEYAQQLLYPIPAVWELLAYDIRNGASCTFYELVDVPDLSLKQPWDRTPSPVFLGGNYNTTSGSSVVTHFTYTVPTGRRLYLSHAQIAIKRWTVATTINQTVASILMNGSVAHSAFMQSNVIGTGAQDESNVQGLILNAGHTISATSKDDSTGGFCWLTITVSGFLFDA